MDIFPKKPAKGPWNLSWQALHELGRRQLNRLSLPWYGPTFLLRKILLYL